VEHARARNKLLYDGTACYRRFYGGDLVYIHDSARNPGVVNKFRKYWSPAHKVLRKLSDWAYGW